MTRRKTVFSILVAAMLVSLTAHYFALREVEIPVWRVVTQAVDPCQLHRPLDIEVYDPSRTEEVVRISVRKRALGRRVEIELGRKPGTKDRYTTKLPGHTVSAKLIEKLLDPERGNVPSESGRTYLIEYRGATDLLEIPACKEIPLELAMNQTVKKPPREKKPRVRPIKLRQPKRKLRKPKPQPKKPPEKKKKATPPKPKPIEKLKQKVVQLNEKKKTEPPKNARFLANIDSSVKKETRALKTNMHRDAMKPKPMPHKANKKRVLMLANKGKPDKPIKKRQPKPKRKRQLAKLMNRRTPQPKPQKERTKPLPDQRDPDEIVKKTDPQPQKPRRLNMFDRARLMEPSLLQQYETFGSKKMERYLDRFRENQYTKGQRMWRKVRQSLENFIPEVTPGKETYLNTRRSEMAVFIATIHRQIHQMWGFGYLMRWTFMGENDPLNKTHLHLKLEIVLDKDGRLIRVAPFGSSGNTTYDIAAITTAYSVRPYPKPPAEAISPNGKVYVHWNFWRDHRQCGTFGAEIKKLAK